MLGLTYSLNPAIDFTKPVIGNTTFSNMTQSWSSSIGEGSLESSQLAAHTVHSYHKGSLSHMLTVVSSMENQPSNLATVP